MRIAQHPRAGTVRAHVTNPAGHVRFVAHSSVAKASVTLAPAVDGDEIATGIIDRATIDSRGGDFTITLESPPPMPNMGSSSRRSFHGGRRATVIGANNIVTCGSMTVGNGQIITGSGTMVAAPTGTVTATVHVPIGSRVRAETTGGDIDVDDSGDLEDVTANTAGGDVTVGSATRVNIRTQGGNITLGHVHLAEAQTQGGEIRLDRATGPVTLASNGGNLHARDLAAGGNLRTQGGNIRATLTGAQKLEASTQGGNVDIHTTHSVAESLVTASSRGGRCRLNGRTIARR